MIQSKNPLPQEPSLLERMACWIEDNYRYAPYTPWEEAKVLLKLYEAQRGGREGE